MKHFLFFLLIQLAGSTFYLQAQSFEAYSNVKQVQQGEVFEVVFTVKDVNVHTITPPSFEGFTVVGPAAISTQMQFINGKSSQQRSWTYKLRSKEIGKKTIGAATVRFAASTMMTKPLTITVVKASSINDLTDGEFPPLFLRAEPSTNEAYPGQQITIDYRIYTEVSIEDIDILEEAAYQGFYFEPMRRFKSAQSQIKLNGKDYITQIIRRVAIFPQQAGNFTLDPMDVSAAVIVGQQGSGFFRRNQTRVQYLSSEPIEIQVKSLPAGAPANFSGAVGTSFEFEAVPARKVVTTDDALTLSMVVAGNGDMKRVQAPPTGAEDAFEIYDPKIVSEDYFEQQGELRGKRIWEYLLLPNEKGTPLIQPSFSYFDPDSAIYITLTSAPHRITVKQGSKTAAERDQDRLQIESNNIRDIAQTTRLRQATQNGFFASPLFWGLLLLPVLGFIGGVAYKKQQSKAANIDPALLKVNRAQKVAQQRLQAAKQYMEAGNSRSFYDEISRASLGYVSDKLGIPNAELSKANLRQKMQDLSLPNSISDNLMDILQNCEIALFAGMDNSAAMSDTYQKTEQVLIQMEEALSAK